MGTLTNSARLIDKIKNIKTTGVETTQPSNPVAGSMYYDQNDGTMKVYDGTEWKELGGGGGGGGGYICTTTDNPAIWPAEADFALVSAYNSNGYSNGPIQFDKYDTSTKKICACAVYLQSTNDGSQISSSGCGSAYQTTFFGKANQGTKNPAFLDILAVGGGAAGNTYQGGSGGGICHMIKMPIYSSATVPVTVGAGGTGSGCAGCPSIFLSIRACGGVSGGASGYPTSCPAGTNVAHKPTDACYTCYSYGGAGGYTAGGNGCGSNCLICLGDSNCAGCGYAQDAAWLIKAQGNGGDGYTTNISGTNHTYGGGGGNGFIFNNWLTPGNYGSKINMTRLPSCGGGAGGNGFGYNRYEVPVFGYNGCYTCRVPGRCFVVTDEGNHCTDATYYGGGGGSSGCASSGGGGGGGGCPQGTAGKGYQGIVIVRYPTDGSYGISNDSQGGDITTCTIDGKEWRIHTFTCTSSVCCFYMVLK